MLVYGEAGMGKSRLAAELAERVGGLGATVLWGASYAMESAPPYGPLIVALEGFAIRMTRAGLHALLGDSAEELARLVPAIGTSLGSMAPAPLEAMDRRRLYSAMGQFFRRFAERSPVLLVLDDLQAADDATLDLAQYLARTLQDVPFLILGLVRTQGKRPDKRIASLAPVTRAVSLSPLNLDDIHRLVASVLSGSVSDDVPRVINTVARGNPFYVLEAIDAMAGRGYITNVEGVWCMNQHNQAPHERLQVRRGEGH